MSAVPPHRVFGRSCDHETRGSKAELPGSGEGASIRRVLHAPALRIDVAHIDSQRHEEE